MAIKNLQVKTKIGVYTWEQRVNQTVIMDIAWQVDAAKLACQDNFADATDYTAVAKAIREHLQDNQYQLLETLAEKTAQHLLQQFAMQSLQLTIRKPGVIPHCDGVVISISRG